MLGTEAVQINGYRLRHTDSISQLYLTSVSLSCGNQVLRNFSGHIGCRTVYLGRILSGKCAAAVMSSAAVGVGNNLTSCKTGICKGGTENKTSGGVYQDAEVGI